MINKIFNFQEDLEIHMKKCIDNFRVNINKIHIGRISPDIVNSITIDYYGVVTPLFQLTNSVVEPPRTVIITVFDPKIVKKVEKSILLSNLGVTPIIHGNIIRIILPILTEDRRFNLIKMVRIESEKSKISIRNIRRTANDKIKFFLKKKQINEDDERYFQNEIQNLTNIWIKKIHLILKEKELEIMKF